MRLDNNYVVTSPSKAQPRSSTQTPLPCIGLSNIDSKLYTNFDFYEGKYHKHSKNTLMYKAKEFMLTKTI